MRPQGLRQPWWRERWVGLAVVVAVAQFAILWFLSAQGDSPRPPHTSPKYAFVIVGKDTGVYSEWLSLMSPGVFLEPSTRDFSGDAWLRHEPSEIAFERLTVESHPLGYSPISSWADPPPLLPHSDPRPASRWTTSPSVFDLPQAASIPMAARGQILIETGFESWHLPLQADLPAAPDGAPLEATVLKVTINSRGEVALPPLIWRSSGSAPSDEAALRVASTLLFEQDGEGDNEAADDDKLSWGLVRIEWGRSRPANSP